MAGSPLSDKLYNVIGFLGDPVSEQLLNNAIKDSGMSFAEARQGNVSSIISFLKEHRAPKVLMIDISDSELPLGDVAKIKEFCSPDVNIITIGSRNDVGLFRDFMAMGVSDYLIKPLSNNLLRHAIEVANGTTRRGVGKTGKMIYVTSSVGGAGSTTVATNIAWILANRHFKRTAIVDVDFAYGTANLMLDVKTENSYLDVLESSDKVDDYFVDTILKKCDQRLYYLGGLVDLLRGINADVEAFEALMANVKKHFNYIIVDSPRDISGINKASRAKTDYFVIMVEMSVASAQNTARMLEFFFAENPERRVMVIANKIGLSSGGAITKESFEKIIDRKIDYSMPLDESTTLAAANIGQPLVMSAGPLTDVLESITDTLIGKREDQEVAEAVIEQQKSAMAKIKQLTADAFDKFVAKLG
ncbi:MAG: AAA family ATPase [Holosporaceae bacterium]|jgi:pilus assembly protein CpaE|nr:AAA family ATPase [Holosporaceae bacterium]